MSQDQSVPQGDRPENLDPAWRFMPLNEDRKPVKSEADDPRFWEGAPADWDAFQEWVSAGGTIGILPERSGLVIIDCDAKREFVVDGSTARFKVHHGIDDLKRVAAEHGEKVEPTFTVKTKSGGYHLYYLQNPQLLVGSKGHRQDWRVDVKASRNVYAVAAPSVGYEVVRDMKAAVLPLWLASWVATLHQSTKGLGYEAAVDRIASVAAWKLDIQVNGASSNLFEMWCLAMLEAVEVAGQVGGWNNAIYRVAREFFDIGITEQDALDMIMISAKPWDGTQRQAVIRTVSSAWRGHIDKTDYA